MRHGLYTIPSGTDLLRHLAKGLLSMARDDGDEFSLSRMRVLLPTRRAGRELRDTFLKLSGDKPILLPRLQPIGDVDAEEIEITLSGYGIIDHDIPPAISSLERQFLLSNLIQKRDPSLGLDAALSLAKDLGSLIDTVHTEDLDFSGLEKIVPDTLSVHWQKTLEFLEIITRFWPDILLERGQIDSADRRNRLLKSLTQLWQTCPPKTPIIAAGSTGSIPSAGELLKTIANLPCGLVILPGFDKDLDQESWDNITDTHPQATMKNLLNRMDKARSDVRFWPESEEIIPSRSSLVRAIMRPAETFGKKDNEPLIDGLKGVEIIEAGTPREEAGIIALALREAMETEERTACFVTPDRDLARRVMTALRRWEIEVDDSAGGILLTTNSSTFLVSLLRVVEENFSPLVLLDFLKHDFQRLIKPEPISQFERYILRGSRPSPGINGLRRRALNKEKSEDIVDLIEKSFQSLLLLADGKHSLDSYCEALITVAETWTTGDKFLWSRPESNSLSSFLSGVINYAELAPTVLLCDFGRVFRELLSHETYRADDSPHRRILILGQLESRLITRDVMILGGLNEGTWPRNIGHDPWMSHPMRRNFGLPPAERLVGLSAHDFAEHFSNRQVIITRSLKTDGTASVPARWLEKLRSLLKAEGQEQDWANSGRYLGFARMIDKPASTIPHSALTPEPCPPIDKRPQELSATWIEKWMNNPYRVYAEKILCFKVLDPIDKDTTHADRGSFVHDVLLDFVKFYPLEIPGNARDILVSLGQKKLVALEYVAPHWHYWWPRFERLIDWFLAEEKKWRKEALPWIQEEKGTIVLYKNPETDRQFTVTAKADRIDRLKLGGAVVMDYKTGPPPPFYKIKNGMAPQLPIESLILKKGGYLNAPQVPENMTYWKLSGSHSAAGEVKNLNLDMPDILSSSEEGLLRLIEKFENQNTPYIAKVITGRLYDDARAYSHLARTTEWSSGEPDDDTLDET